MVRLAALKVHLSFAPHRRRPGLGLPAVTDTDVVPARLLPRAAVAGERAIPLAGDARPETRVALPARDL